MPPPAQGPAPAVVVAGVGVETEVGAVPEAWLEAWVVAWVELSTPWVEAKRSERKAATAGACQWGAQALRARLAAH